jgi:serine protease AprX
VSIFGVFGQGGRRTNLAVLAVTAVWLVFAGVSWGATSSYSPSTDGYSMYNLTAQMGARAWWNAGYTGKGVDVALIDTGVSPVQGINGTGKVAYGPDLSLESQSSHLRNLDTNGHGTFMAGLIAGHDSTLSAPYSSAPASAYRGVAPDARIVSLKVATADGGTDVTQVIAAIDWVVQHAHDPGFNIRVINLSYGTNSTQAYTSDPLAYAAEQAWKHGIVVVAAAGNTGYQKGKGAEGVADPAYDPYVIAAGGYDTMGTAAVTDDAFGAYTAATSSCGGCKNPDFDAPGSHLQGLRDPGSYIDQNHPEGVINARYFRGTGTSEATAITSGVVALILQKYPKLTPDQVKRFIATNGQLIPNTAKAQGSGEISLAKLAPKAPVAYTQSFTNAKGTGSVELSRGSDHIAANGVVLTGEQDIFGHAFNAAALATAEAAASSWSGGMWNGNLWSGSSWSGSSWSGSTWSGSSWSGSSWSGSSWSGNTWSGSSWSGSSWSGSSWSGSSWSGGGWAGGSWG